MVKNQADGGVKRLVKGAAITSAAAAAAAGLWIAYSHVRIDHSMPLRAPLGIEPRFIHTRAAGDVAVYEDRSGKGRPLVLVHSVNAAASAYEMGPIFARYRGNRPVIAIDLPGFGLSSRKNIDYSPRLYQEALLETLHTLGDDSVDLVALSLGCEFAARTAAIEPERFHSLIFISPSGFSERASAPANDKQQRTTARRQRWFLTPLWARPLFDLIATRPSIRYFLKLAFRGDIPDDFISYDYAAAHRPGAEFAPLSFISGRLFTPGIVNTFYALLSIPVLVAYDQDAFTDFSALPGLLRRRANWHAVRIPGTRGLPQFEQMDALSDAMGVFWDEAERQAAA
jgi:pimeloyl-ACP methyl ester carboxylesterase